MDILTVLNGVIPIFILIGVGFAAAKYDILKSVSLSSLSSFVVNVTMPCMIIASMQVPVTDETFSGVISAFIAMAVFNLISIAAALIVVPRYVKDKSQLGIHKFLTIFSNLGFMGLPIANALFGPQGVLYASIFVLGFNILVFPIGILLLSPQGSSRHLNIRLVMNAGTISALIGIFLFFTGLRIPEQINTAVTLLGDVTTPAAMAVTGAFIAGMPLKSIFSDRLLYITAALRLLIIPAVVCFAVSLITSDPLIIAVSAIEAAMPGAASTVLMAEVYGGDAQTASKGVLLTTILCIATIPMVAVFAL